MGCTRFAPKTCTGPLSRRCINCGEHKDHHEVNPGPVNPGPSTLPAPALAQQQARNISIQRQSQGLELPGEEPKQQVDLQLVDPSDAAGPFDESNWVISGALLAGRNPGEPAERATLLEALLDLGVTTYVCLQPRDELRKRPYEAYAARLDELVSGNPCWAQPTALWCPTDDGGTFKQGELSELVEDLVLRIRDHGERVYVHCHGGHGRTGVVCALVVARLFGFGSTEALDHIQRTHDARVNTHDQPSPQTHEQKMQVHQLVAGWR